MKTLPWTSQDLEMLPNNGKRYEIIDGELYISTQPHYYHQRVCGLIFKFLDIWSEQTEAGEANLAPGLIFAEDDDVAPDVIWTSRERLTTALQPDGKLHTAPELVVEVLSPGMTNERRDREFKLRLYSRRGVLEYWIVNWQERQVDHRRVIDLLCSYHSSLLRALLPQKDRPGTPLRRWSLVNQMCGSSIRRDRHLAATRRTGQEVAQQGSALHLAHASVSESPGDTD